MTDATRQDEEGDGAATTGPLVRELPIVNKRGLHDRASAKFLQCVERFDANVAVSRAGETVDGTSIMGIMTLAAARGTTLTVAAEGPAAAAVLEALADLVATRFGEDE
jgi:phosphocarrier protein